MSYEQLEALVGELRGLIARLETTINTLNATAVSQAERIADLERLLEESRRSGKRQAAPFSKGAPKIEPKTPGRKRGQAYGRHATRPIPQRVDREFDAPVPTRCACGGDIEVTGTAVQYQTDLPAPAPVVTRFRVVQGCCRACHRRVQGRHPEQTSDALGAACVQIGPNAVALGVILHYQHGLSFARAVEVLAQLGVPMRTSTLVRAAARTGAGLEATYQALLDELNQARMLTMDESGWRVGGMPAWLWVATTATATAYAVCDGRAHTDACQLIDATFSGVLVRDGWAVYRKYTNATHQSCAAHLLRRCSEMIEALPAHERSLARSIKAVFQDALAARDLDTDARAVKLADVTERIGLLCDGPVIGAANKRLVKHLRKEAGALFTFLTADDIDATNWRAETAIRPAVVNRKVWGGNRTSQGATTWARIASVLRTARQQGHDAITMLVALAREPASHQLNAFA